MLNQQVRDYRIEKELGKGGMGTVYLAKDTAQDILVAIKVLQDNGDNPETLERFQREGQALRTLNHPNIVDMLDAFGHEGKQYLVMEYISGGDLDDLLQKEKQLSIRQTLEIALELADALTRAHHLNIIHRDIKPGNVLLGDDGTPHLTDFGIAHYQKEKNLTQEGAIIGTIPYLSPEGCQGKALDARSDIWAFGVLLFELLTGEQPFKGDNLMAIVNAILTVPMPDLEAMRPDAPESLVDLIYRMLAKTADARIPSVRQVGLEIEGMLKGFEVTPAGKTSRALFDSAQGKPSLFADATPSPTHKRVRLPAQSVPFVGREKELAEINELLAKPTTRLLTLLGPGGMGKTRLGIESASRAQEDFAQGVTFVDLAPLDAGEKIPAAIASALDYHFGKEGRPEDQLKNYLGNKELLLVMDNFEHVLEGALFVAELLEAAPQVKVLATSRAQLNLQEEYIYETGGMIAPAHEDDTVFEEFEAVELFITYARRTQLGYELSETDKAAVVKICRLVGGMPLGIELSAGWIRTLPPEDIAEELEHDLDFLSSKMKNLPPRQRSMRAVFDYSWKLLDEKTQTAFMQLCVFRGGFTREAASAVANTRMRMLSTLTEHSLLKRNPAGRFAIHELMRQFGREKLEEDQAGYQATLARHWGYYADWLHAMEHDLKYHITKKAPARILTEIENITQGWLWAVEQQDIEGLDKANFSIIFSLELLDQHQVIGQLYHSAAEALEPYRDDSNEHRILWWQMKAAYENNRNLSRGQPGEEESAVFVTMVKEFMLTDQFRKLGYFVGHLYFSIPPSSRLTMGVDWAEEVNKMIDGLNETGDSFERGSLLFLNGTFHQNQLNRPEEALDYFERSYKINREIGSSFVINTATGLGFYWRVRGDYHKALKYYQEGFEAAQRVGDQYGIAFILLFIGRTFHILGQSREAEEAFEACILLYKELNIDVFLGFALYFVAAFNATQGNFKIAEGQIQESYQLLENYNPEGPEFCFCLFESGRLAYYQGEPDKAEEYFARCRALAEKQIEQNEDNYFMTHLRLMMPYRARAAHAASENEEAWGYFKEALAINLTESMYLLFVMNALSGLAALLADEGRLEEAVEVGALPASHQATAHYHRQPVLALLEKLAGEMDTDVFAAAKERGEKLEPGEIYEQLFG